MPTRPLRALLLAFALAHAAPVGAVDPDPATSPAAVAAIDASTGAILQGDARRALAALDAVPASEFAGADAGYRRCMRTRLGGAAPVYDLEAATDPLVRDVLRLYQDYWWRALRAPAQRTQQEAALLRGLRERLGPAAADAADMDALEPVLQAALRERGHHAQLGRTLPLRELMLWRSQRSRDYIVDLPEGRQRVPVDLLDDFVSRGWSGYARCGRGSAGGWATAERLYAIVPSYREGLDGEAFRVVFLGHEAQHFADQNAFPGIAPWALEYRAKLTELAQAREVSGRRLRGFVSAQSDDPDSPHTYANKRVVADLAARLGAPPERVGIDALQRAARELLAEDTRRRRPGPR
ncbi:hypothetical protein [Vulcaniibacterium tengchongense]|uniref:Uncharacterized protein n=1 Tax=Vulcaniibacterium tengchongense TaxID=1273429 RepID=A0A3N4VKH0_9GAMM|nr:hypothetical protein [Vulcaniibacterium tengchongense]RPE79771.1 hypothetical protein EDC50_1597 [Vulcaniibacterium tengchongense]